MRPAHYLLFCLALLAQLLATTQAQAQGKGKKGKKGKESALPAYLLKASTAEEIRQTENKLEKVYRLFIGHFSNKVQADTTNMAIYAEQELITVPIWQERTGEYWLYWVWITANQPDLTLCEGIFQLSKLNRDTFTVQHYGIPKEMAGKTALEWSKAKPFQGYAPRDLPKFPCQAHVVEREKDKFELIMPQPCEEFDLSNFGEIKGMIYAQMLTPEVLHDYCEYFDAEGNLLFTYDKPIGLYLERLDRNKPKYNKL